MSDSKLYLLCCRVLEAVHSSDVHSGKPRSLWPNWRVWIKRALFAGIAVICLVGGRATAGTLYNVTYSWFNPYHAGDEFPSGYGFTPAIFGPIWTGYTRDMGLTTIMGCRSGACRFLVPLGRRSRCRDSSWTLAGISQGRSRLRFRLYLTPRRRRRRTRILKSILPSRAHRSPSRSTRRPVTSGTRKPS
jgi:hypothetical protein